MLERKKLDSDLSLVFFLLRRFGWWVVCPQKEDHSDNNLEMRMRTNTRMIRRTRMIMRMRMGMRKKMRMTTNVYEDGNEGEDTNKRTRMRARMVMGGKDDQIHEALDNDSISPS